MNSKVSKILEGNGISPRSGSKLSDDAGRMKDVFHVESSEGRDYGVYIYRQPGGGERGRSIKQRIAAEKHIFSKIRNETSLRAPEVIDSGENFLLCTWLEGEPLGSKDLSSEERVELAERMGEGLSEIHEIRYDKFGEIDKSGYSTFETWPGFISELIDFIRENSEKKLVEDAVKFLEENIELVNHNPEPVLIQGDFHTGNILSGDKLGIVDCESGFIGSREYEIFRCISHWAEEWGSEEAFLDGYGRENLDSDWRNRESYYEILQASMGVIDGKNLGSKHLVEINQEGLREELEKVGKI